MRVIIATDGSIEADIATAVLKRLPFPRDATVTVAMVTPAPAALSASFAPQATAVLESTTADTWRIQRQIAKYTVDAVAERLKVEGVAAEPLVLEGDPAGELLDLIRQQNADLVVAGCGVNSNFAAFFLGSVSRKLVLYSEASVLVGRHYEETQAEGSYNRIKAKTRLDVLIAVDGSKGSNLTIESLANVKTPVFRNVYVLAVEPPAYRLRGVDSAALQTGSEAGSAYYDVVAREAAQSIGSSGEYVQALTSFGRPSSEIAKMAKEKDVDLVMLGANRHGALDRFVLGSCAYETATSAPCSVLILRDALPFTGGSR